MRPPQQQHLCTHAPTACVRPSADGLCPRQLSQHRPNRFCHALGGRPPALHLTPNALRAAGNLLVLRDGRVGYIDFGIVGRVAPSLWTAVQALLGSAAAGDYLTMARALCTLGVTATDVDIPVRAPPLRLPPRARSRRRCSSVQESVARAGMAQPASASWPAWLQARQHLLQPVTTHACKVACARGRSPCVAQGFAPCAWTLRLTRGWATQKPVWVSPGQRGCPQRPARADRGRAGPSVGSGCHAAGVCGGPGAPVQRAGADGARAAGGRRRRR